MGRRASAYFREAFNATINRHHLQVVFNDPRKPIRALAHPPPSQWLKSGVDESTGFGFAINRDSFQIIDRRTIYDNPLTGKA